MKGLMLITIAKTSNATWRTTSHCTSNTSNSAQLELNCNDGLLYISWSHYGHRVNNNAMTTTPSTASNNCSYDASQSSTDCTVSVDYVANECNGLPQCQISLDSQYLHSCKAYSHYLFIVYQCIPIRQTRDICQHEREQSESIVQLVDTFYLKYIINQ